MHFSFYAYDILYISPYNRDPEKFILTSYMAQVTATSIAHGQSLPGLLLAYYDVMPNLLGLFVVYILLAQSTHFVSLSLLNLSMTIQNI